MIHLREVTSAAPMILATAAFGQAAIGVIFKVEELKISAAVTACAVLGSYPIAQISYSPEEGRRG